MANSSNKNDTNAETNGVAISFGPASANNTKIGIISEANNLDQMTNLRDVCNFIQSTMKTVAPPGGYTYNHIIDMMRELDLQDDGIVMNRKIKDIEIVFCEIVKDENMLYDCMTYLNEKAVTDGDLAIKFALLFSSRSFDALAMKDIKIRSTMLKILETNYINSHAYRINEVDRLYNSITLLGEYYHRVRLANNSPIRILADSLLNLLLREINDQNPLDIRFARVLLSQITLNGEILRREHKDELESLLFHIRRCLIEQTIPASIRALLLLTIELDFNKFDVLDRNLRNLYTKYVIPEAEFDCSNIFLDNPFQNQENTEIEIILPTQIQQQQHQVQQQQQSSVEQYPQTQQTTSTNSQSKLQQRLTPNHNLTESNISDDSGTKTWSQQMNDDSQLENEITRDFNGDEYNNYGGCDSVGVADDNCNSIGPDAVGGIDGDGFNNFGDRNEYNNRQRSYSGSSRNSFINNNNNSNQVVMVPQNRYDENDNFKRNQRGGFKQRNSQRHHHLNQDIQQQHSNEERDDAKPLPKWRATRFNRENDPNAIEMDHHQRRYSIGGGGGDEDRRSIRSDGGSIRLYSVNDRLKLSQEKFDRNNITIGSAAIANWDRNSQRDDRSERSYRSNYERGGNHRRFYNNRQTYDKPPRFQKNEQKLLQSQHQPNNHNNQQRYYSQQNLNTTEQQQQHHHQQHHHQQQHQQHHQHQQQRFNMVSQQQQQHQQQQHQHQQHHTNQNVDKKIHSDSWRRSSQHGSNPFNEENVRARTLPRQNKFGGSSNNVSPMQQPAHFRRSQSPLKKGGRQQHDGNIINNNNSNNNNNNNVNKTKKKDVKK